MKTNPILPTPTLTVEDLALAVPANDHDRRSARRSRLRAQLRLETARYGSARRRLQSVLDSGTAAGSNSSFPFSTRSCFTAT
jgi:hypothetical protein